MPEHTPIDLLREMLPGDVLTASVLNAIVRAVRATMMGDEAITDGQTGIAFRRKTQARAAFPVVAHVFEPVPMHAVLGAWEGAGSGQEAHCVVHAGKVGLYGSGASPLGLFTNDRVAASPPESGGSVQLWLRPLNDYDTVLLPVTGDLPHVGEPCGPNLDTWGITAGQSGFVCLSEPVAGGGGSGSGEYAALDHVWVIRAADPPLLVGRVHHAPAGWWHSGSGSGGADGGPGDDPELALTSGTLRVMYRSSGGALEEARSPIGAHETPWDVTFWARGRSGETPSGGEFIQVCSTAGVGFLHLKGGGARAIVGKTVGSGAWDMQKFATVQRQQLVDLGTPTAQINETEAEDRVLNLFAPLDPSAGDLYVAYIETVDGILLAIAAQCEPTSGGSG